MLASSSKAAKQLMVLVLVETGKGAIAGRTEGADKACTLHTIRPLKLERTDACCIRGTRDLAECIIRGPDSGHRLLFASAPVLLKLCSDRCQAAGL